MFKVGDKVMAIDTYYNPYTLNVAVRKNEIRVVTEVFSRYYIAIENYSFRIRTSNFINYTKFERKQKLKKLCLTQEIE
jgi:hypothetical protein